MVQLEGLQVSPQQFLERCLAPAAWVWAAFQFPKPELDLKCTRPEETIPICINRLAIHHNKTSKKKLGQRLMSFYFKQYQRFYSVIYMILWIIGVATVQSTCPPVSGKPSTPDWPKYPWGDMMTTVNTIGILARNFSKVVGSGAWSMSNRSRMVSNTRPAVLPHPFSSPISCSLHTRQNVHQNPFHRGHSSSLNCMLAEELEQRPSHLRSKFKLRFAAYPDIEWLMQNELHTYMKILPCSQIYGRCVLW